MSAKQFKAEKPKKSVNAPSQRPVQKGRRRGPKRPRAQKNNALFGLTAPQKVKDGRLPRNDYQALALKNQNPTITVEVPSFGTTVTAFVIGYLSRALAKGWEAYTDSIGTPFFALNYMSEMLILAMNGGTPALQQLPLWLLNVAAALRPKTVPFQLGLVAYKWGQISFNLVPWTVSVGFEGGYQWTCAPQDTNTTRVNGFPVVLPLSSQPAYTSDLGQTGVQSLFQFMTDKDEPGTRLVPVNIKTPCDRDASVFAVPGSNTGKGLFGPAGGVCSLYQHEIPLFRPLLASFNTNASDPNNQLTRFYNWSLPGAGDSTFLGGVISTVYPLSHLGSKVPPKMKPVDFLEFGDVLARWVQKIVTSALNNTDQYVGQIQTSVVDKIVCPLTLQEMLLILRNTMMSAFKDSQAATQGTIPYVPNTPGIPVFQPFIAGSNTISLMGLDMQLPMGMIENLRALVLRTAPYKRGLLAWMPILGQYIGDVLASADYSITYKDENGVIQVRSVFATGALYRKLSRTSSAKDAKSVPIMLAEAAISMIDGSSGSSLVCINDTARLKELIALWNGWLAESGVGSFTMQLGTFGTEKGITALGTIFATRHWQVVTSNQREAEKLEVDVRFEKPGNMIRLSPYATRKVLADTSQGTFLATCYEQVLATWIMPCNVPEASFEVTGVQSTAYQRWQEIMGEPFTVTSITSSTSQTLAALHDAYASKMTRGNLSSQNDWEKLFELESAQGRGGVLSSIIAGLAGTIFPKAAPIANAIADVIPI